MHNIINLNFRKATSEDISEIWNILQQAIERRRKDGSRQWQDGYPNINVVENDIEKRIGYVLTDSSKIIGYCAIIFNNEPAYDNIDGEWITQGDFIVIHRVAILDSYLGKGLAQKIFFFIEQFAVDNDIYSIKVDTNFDNSAMLSIFKKLGYVYCGEVYFRGNARKAFEKVLYDS